MTKARRSTPRSRVGCMSCKTRKIKCGEEKPRCSRCIASNFSCDYNSKPGVVTGAAVFALRSQSATPIGTSPRNLSIDPRLLEQLYLQRFVQEKSSNLQGFDPFIWRGPALQEYQNNDCLRHAMVAIGALMASAWKSSSGSYFMDTSYQNYHRQGALEHHQEALKIYQEIHQESTEQLKSCPENLRKILICCLVLAFFDIFIGNSNSAIQHIRYAMLLRLAIVEKPSDVYDEASNQTEEEDEAGELIVGTISCHTRLLDWIYKIHAQQVLRPVGPSSEWNKRSQKSGSRKSLAR